MRGALPHSVERILAAAITEWKHDVHASIFFLQLSPADSDCCTCKMGPYTSCSGTPLGTGTLHSGLRAIPHARKVPKLRPPPRQSSEGGAFASTTNLCTGGCLVADLETSASYLEKLRAPSMVPLPPPARSAPFRPSVIFGSRFCRFLKEKKQILPVFGEKTLFLISVASIPVIGV